MEVQIRVDTDQIRNVAQVFDNTIQAWRSQVSEIWNALAELDAMWDGDANTEFNALTNEDKPNFDLLSEVLENFQDALEKAVENYEQNENAVKQIVQG